MQYECWLCVQKVYMERAGEGGREGRREGGKWSDEKIYY
jgi:hypothetical protein